MAVQLTLIINALMKTAGMRSLYVFVTKQPPRIVAALLANVNCSMTVVIAVDKF